MANKRIKDLASTAEGWDSNTAYLPLDSGGEGTQKVLVDTITNVAVVNAVNGVDDVSWLLNQVGMSSSYNYPPQVLVAATNYFAPTLPTLVNQFKTDGDLVTSIGVPKRQMAQYNGIFVAPIAGAGFLADVSFEILPLGIGSTLGSLLSVGYNFYNTNYYSIFNGGPEAAYFTVYGSLYCYALDFGGNTLVQSIDIGDAPISQSVWYGAGGVNLAGCTNLGSVTFKAEQADPSTDCPADYIVEFLDDNGVTNGTVNVNYPSGGSTAFSSAGATYVGNLIAKGWTITENPY